MADGGRFSSVGVIYRWDARQREEAGDDLQRCIARETGSEGPSAAEDPSYRGPCAEGAFAASALTAPI